MEKLNNRIQSALEKNNSNNIFIHKHAFYGKSIHLRRGIRRISQQNHSKGSQTRLHESNIRFKTEPSKSFCFDSHFQGNKSKQNNFNQLEKNSKTVNLNRKNTYFSAGCFVTQIRKINPCHQKKIAIINGRQLCQKKNQDKKIVRSFTDCINLFPKPISIMQVIKSINKGNFNGKQYLRDIQQKQKTTSNNFEYERSVKQTSLKTTTIQSMGYEPYTKSVQIESQDNQNIIIQVNSPKQAKQDDDLKERQNQNITRKTTVLIIEKIKQNQFRSKQQRVINRVKRKNKKVIDKIDIDNTDNYVGPWSKKQRLIEEEQETFIN